jgi:aspartate carbamoyltransferase catalytic subunit
MAGNGFEGQSITSVRQFSRADVERLMDAARAVARHPQRYWGVARQRILATLFYEPSTRTRLSFESAMARLGGQVISTPDARQISSAAKGETLADTVRIISGYCDVLALRHPEAGAADEARRYAEVPVINAGDGTGEHPTQALLDAFTIREAVGRLDDLTVTVMGDLAFGRTAHSLALLLARFDRVTLRLVAPPPLQLPDGLLDELERSGVRIEPEDRIAAALNGTDVLYVTRLQKERLPKDFPADEAGYGVDADVLARLPAHAIILHPLPRVRELPQWVDNDPRARYFEQARLGVFVRMALLMEVLGVGDAS